MKKEKLSVAPESDKYEIESWCRTLREAEAIKADPEKMKKLAPYLKKELSSMEELRKLISEEEGED